jgi:hypothetical protein
VRDVREREVNPLVVRIVGPIKAGPLNVLAGGFLHPVTVWWNWNAIAVADFPERSLGQPETLGNSHRRYQPHEIVHFAAGEIWLGHATSIAEKQDSMLPESLLHLDFGPGTVPAPIR